MNAIAQLTVASSDAGGSFLVQPGLGTMIWTLLAFGITMMVLKRLAFPKISDALEERAEKVAKNIEESERQRKEADELLNEYRERLKEAREQADDIIARAKKAGDTAKATATDEGREKREELVAAARKDIEAETKRSLEQIRKEVADLTVLATEKVDPQVAHRRRSEEARRGGPRRGRLRRPQRRERRFEELVV